jgi:exonuclease VII small subunit
LQIGSQKHKRYSRKAFEKIISALEEISMEDVLKKYKER